MNAEGILNYCDENERQNTYVHSYIQNSNLECEDDQLILLTEDNEDNEQHQHSFNPNDLS